MKATGRCSLEGLLVTLGHEIPSRESLSVVDVSVTREDYISELSGNGVNDQHANAAACLNASGWDVRVASLDNAATAISRHGDYAPIFLPWTILQPAGEALVSLMVSGGLLAYGWRQNGPPVALAIRGEGAPSPRTDKMPPYVRQVFIGGPTRTLVILERTIDNSLSGSPSLTTTKLRGIDQWLVDQAFVAAAAIWHAYVHPRRSQAFLGHHFEPCRQQDDVYSRNDFAGGKFGWCWSVDIARVLAVRSPETDEQHGPDNFGDAAYTALRYPRKGGQILDPELDGGPLDNDEELRGIRNSFGSDDAGTCCNSHFDTQASAPLVVGVHLVNGFLEDVVNMYIGHTFPAAGRKYPHQMPSRLQPPTYLSDAGHVLLDAPNWQVLEPVRQFMATRHTTAGHFYNGPDQIIFSNVSPTSVPYWPVWCVRIDPIAVPVSRWAFVTAPLAVAESLVRYVTYPMAFAALSFRTIGASGGDREYKHGGGMLLMRTQWKRVWREPLEGSLGVDSAVVTPSSYCIEHLIKLGCIASADLVDMTKPGYMAFKEPRYSAQFPTAIAMIQATDAWRKMTTANLHPLRTSSTDDSIPVRLSHAIRILTDQNIRNQVSFVLLRRTTDEGPSKAQRRIAE
ncbi:hypothetical protein FNAPI_13599 [Fusarium napiforme]|uniref:Uncharacterized protein n=1 Tax=Fusarium napiforme TaxID=42672 RepID=A0A8H5MIU3_9HYPO|nr:hypothetical protein FNAPI_13599 [Fusarium napiforme]